MDHTKCKTFIGFVNIDKKDRFWCDGNSVWDSISPKIFPYETKEEKESAQLTGHHILNWDETGSEVVGIIFKVHETVPLISKKDAEILEIKQKEKRLKEKEKILNEDNPEKSKKKISEPIIENVPEKIVEIKKEEPQQIQRTRGRPRKNPLIEE